ncbi:MAG TPA: DEAD/DEAH box helicase, partial [Sphingomicrobium sp.]|nr:DEAD/DEAH box helicase [Sphingomicrobium sp.]
MTDLPPVVHSWFDSKGWAPRRHQLEMLELARRGRSALLVAATGAGKTLAGFLPTICELAEKPAEGLHTLYVSPLKALAVDVQRNLIGPIEEMGLPIRVETRTGDTPSDRKARQRLKPPQVLLTTPESLSLLLSYPDSVQMFEGLRTFVVDELHGFAKEKRGDLLSLSMSRLQKLAPEMRRVGLSATISDPDAYRSWLAPDSDMALVDPVLGDPGAEPDLSILIPENKIPWGGHSGYHAIADVMRLIEQHKTTLVFSNTRGLAELIFQKLWDENEQGLPIGIHHGSLSIEARRKVEAAMAAGKLRGLVATASLDLGIDWGDVDLVIQMGAPKGSSRLLQRIGRSNHRLDEPSKGIIVPGNRFEYLEARAALDAIDDGELDPEVFRPGALDVLAQHILAMAVAAPFQQEELLAEIRSAAPYAGLKEETFEEILNFIATGGYALKAYDRFRRLVPEA